MKQIDCWECEGNGYTYTTDDDSDKEYEIDCPYCWGAGYVEEDDADEYETDS